MTSFNKDYTLMELCGPSRINGPLFFLKARTHSSFVKMNEKLSNIEHVIAVLFLNTAVIPLVQSLNVHHTVRSGCGQLKE